MIEEEHEDGPEAEDRAADSRAASSRIIRVVLTERDLRRGQQAGASKASRALHPATETAGAAIPVPSPKAPELVEIALAALGFGSLFVLQLRYALLGVILALVLVAWKLSGALRLMASALALAAAVLASVAWLSQPRHGQPTDQLALGRTRLAIVDEVNRIRTAHKLLPLSFDPQLSILAQKQAHLAVAAHVGLPAQTNVTDLPSGVTNMWAEMAGVSCSWQRLFALSHLAGHVESEHAELGFISGGATVGGGGKGPILSPGFTAVGVGVDYLPRGAVSVALDIVGPAQAGKPAIRSLANLVAMFPGDNDPKCR